MIKRGFIVSLLMLLILIPNTTFASGSIVLKGNEKIETIKEATVEDDVGKELKFVQPILLNNKVKLSSLFGHRIHPITNKWAMHRGVDISAPVGTPIFAITDGVVIDIDSNKTSGNLIKVQHAKNFYTIYSHLDKRAVKIGDVVSMGQVIGTTGNTGMSTGPHLHFEVWINNKAVNGLGFVLGKVK